MYKEGLLFGLNYCGSRLELHGCINDTLSMKNFLETKLKYDRVKCFTTNHQTTCNFIINKLYKLAIKSWRQSIDEVCIYYSGHGFSTIDLQNDEIDSKDEALVPSDIDMIGKNGMIRDDFIKRILRYFNPNTRIVFIVDACHSGTMCDLRYIYKNERFEKKPYIENTGTKCRANVVCISGCKDEQCSYEYSKMDERGNSVQCGLMTSSLISCLTSNPNMSIFDVYTSTCQRVQKVGFKQNPQLTSSFLVSDADSLFLCENPTHEKLTIPWFSQGYTL